MALFDEAFDGYTANAGVIADCEAATNWSAAYGDITVGPAASSTCQVGSNSIGITISASAGNAAIDYTPASAIDLSAQSYVTMWVHTPVLTDFTRVSLYLSDSGDNWNIYRPYLYEGSYDTGDVYYAGWSYKMYDLADPYTDGGADLSDVTVVRIRYDFDAGYAGTALRVDDIRYRSSAATGESGGAWLPPNSNAVFGVHEVVYDEATEYMRVWSTLRDGSAGHGRAYLPNIIVPNGFTWIGYMRLNSTNGWIRIGYDFVMPPTGGATHSSAFISANYNYAGVEQVHGDVAGGRLYDQSAFTPSLATWYKFRIVVDNLTVSFYINGTQYGSMDVDFREDGYFFIEARDGDFTTSPTVASADFHTFSIMTANAPAALPKSPGGIVGPVSSVRNELDGDSNKSDTVDLVGGPYRWMFVGTGGNVNVIAADDTSAVVIPNVQDGTKLPVSVKRLLSTSTTASNIVFGK